MLSEQDRIRISHMLDAVREAQGYIQGKTRVELDTNTMLFRALVNCIEIVGEAAARVDAETRDAISDIPWAQIVAMRNRLIHACFDINKDIVWKTVLNDLRLLEPKLETILATKNNQG